MTLRYDGIDCNCGRKGCFEAYASASALVRQAAEAARKHPDSRLHALVEGDVSRMNGRLFFQAVREGDGTALAVRDAYAQLLAEGLTNLINLLQPEELVIGGGISGAAELFLPQTQERIARRWSIPGRPGCRPGCVRRSSETTRGSWARRGWGICEASARTGKNAGKVKSM